MKASYDTHMTQHWHFVVKKPLLVHIKGGLRGTGTFSPGHMTHASVTHSTTSYR